MSETSRSARPDDAPEAIGRVIGRSLAGAWRPDRAPCDLLADELDHVAPLLHQTGAGALAWWGLQGTPLEATKTGEGLHQAYRLHTLQAELHALRLAEVWRRLETAGIEALLIKGWAVARLYPEAGLRPYSDLDVVVRPGQAQAARAALTRPPAIEAQVDLHDGPSRVDARDFDDLSARAQDIFLGTERVRTLSAEDHLRLLAIHALRHGVFRPIWLVDLAVCVEGRRPWFDWDRCLGPVARQAEWVAAAISLSERLLGARVDGTPAAGRGDCLPGWLVVAVLRNWARATGTSHLPPVFEALWEHRRRPRAAWAEARRRWDRPIEATLEVGGPFNRLPRWPFQVAAVSSRVLSSLA